MAKPTTENMREELLGYVLLCQDEVGEWRDGQWLSTWNLFLPAACDAQLFVDSDRDVYVFDLGVADKVVAQGDWDGADPGAVSDLFIRLHAQIEGASHQQIEHYYSWAGAMIDR